jgi:hypothetical protein
MRKQHHRAPDDSLAAWQEWMSHTPGYWRSSGRVPPTGRYGRRPTTTDPGCITAGSLLLVALGIGLLGVLATLLHVNAVVLIALVGLAAAGGAGALGAGRRGGQPNRSPAKRRRHRP